jgi:LmbE family N-acetylglucosaminyl deacetylase
MIAPDFVVDVTEFVPQKFEAIKAFRTQFWDPDSTEPKTPISGEEFFQFLEGRMAEFGRGIGVRYAEGFCVERVAGVELLTDLR